MSTSVRSYLVAGAAAATATAVALAPVQAAPPDIAVPANSAVTQPQLTQAMVDLLAAASRMTAAVTPKAPTGGAPASGIAPAAAVTGDVSVQNAASDWLTWAYTGIQSWVNWGVDYAQEIAYWLGGWGVPFAGLIGDQIGIFYDDLIRPIADGIFYDLIVPVVNNPLNLGVWFNGIVNAVGAGINAAVDFGVSEFNYFFGWILPPLPGPPPNWPFNTLAATSSVSTLSSVGTLNAASDVINAVYNPIRYAVTVGTDTLQAVLAPIPIVHIAGDQIDLLSDTLVLPVTDSLVRALDGVVNAPLNITSYTNGLADIGFSTVDALINTGVAEFNYVVGFPLAAAPQTAGLTKTSEVSSVPPSVSRALTAVKSTRATLQTGAEKLAENVEATVTETGKAVEDLVTRAPGKSVGVKDAGKVTTAADNQDDSPSKVASKVQSRVKDAADAAKKARQDTRDAVRAAVKNATPKAKNKEAKAKVKSEDSSANDKK